MFHTKEPTVHGNIVDIAVGKGLFSMGGMKALYDKQMGGMADARPGGFTCNLCQKKVEPTRILTWVRAKDGKPGYEEDRPLAMVDEEDLDPGSIRSNVNPRVRPANERVMVIKNICQGYFCHHREMNSTALRLHNRCFSVCMECAVSKRMTYPAAADRAPDMQVHMPAADEPGYLMRHHVMLSKEAYTMRLEKINKDFLERAFIKATLERGAPSVSKWETIVDAALVSISGSEMALIPREGGAHVPRSVPISELAS